jgi:DNA-binding Lrp family transcriptional regulator
MTRWFRFYEDTVNDPKVLRLSDELYRAWTILLCFASKHEGKLPPADDIAIALRVKPSKVCEWITKLVKGGLIDQTEAGFEPHNWNGRQYKSDVSTDRVKRFRQRERNVSVTPPEQSRAETETEQSRTDAGGKISVSEKVLKTDLMEAFGPSRSPDLSRTSVWLSKGYSSTLILEVVRDGLARKPDIATLNYFDAALADKHATRPESPSERAAARVDMDKVAEMFKKTGVWSKYAGPEPGMTGCKCPPEILAKHGIMAPGIRRLDA